MILSSSLFPTPPFSLSVSPCQMSVWCTEIRRRRATARRDNTLRRRVVAYVFSYRELCICQYEETCLRNILITLSSNRRAPAAAGSKRVLLIAELDGRSLTAPHSFLFERGCITRSKVSRTRAAFIHAIAEIFYRKSCKDQRFSLAFTARLKMASLSHAILL